MTFVGRIDELAALRGRWLRTAQTGNGSVVQIIGPAGIGKTSLVQEWLHTLPPKTFVLHTRADDFSRGVLEPIRWAVENAAVPADAPEATATREAILSLLRGATAPPPHGIADLLVDFLDQAAQGRPIAVVFEDLHAADHDTVSVCGQLARDTGSARLLVVTSRPYRGNTALDFAGLVNSLADFDQGLSIELGPMSSREVIEVVREDFGRAPTSTEITGAVAVSRGNPLFLRLWLLSTTPASEGPQAESRQDPAVLQVIHEELLHRYVAPGSLGWSVATRMALLGRCTWDDADLLSDLLDIPVAEITAVMGQLIDQGVLTQIGGQIGFVYPQAGEALAALLGEEAGQQFHLEVADWLCADGAPVASEALFEVAAHLIAARKLPTAAHAEVMFHAALAAMWVSPAPAAQWFEQVRESPVTPESMRAQALSGQITAYTYGGATASARTLCQQALLILDPALHTPELIEAAAANSFATASLHELIAQAEQAPPEKRNPGTRSLLATAYALVGQTADALTHYEPVIHEVLTAEDVRHLPMPLTMLFGPACLLGRIDDLVALRTRALEAAQDVDPLVREMLLTAVDMYTHHFPAYVRHDLVDLGSHTNKVSAGGGREVNQSFQNYLDGRWDTLLASASPLIELLRSSGNLIAVSMPAACAALVLVERERWDEAEAYLQQATWPWETSHGPLLAVAAAKIHLARGQAESALERLEEAYDWGRVEDQTMLHTMVADQLAQVLESRGDLEAARTIARDSLDRVEAMDVPLLNAFGYLAVARTTTSLETAHQALVCAELVGSPLLRIRCEILLAELGDDPAERLNRAHRQSKQIGAVSERSRIEQTMRRLGVPTPRGRGTEVELTAAESAVVRSLLRGSTNRQIAETLYCSTKTVEMHLSRIYARTGRSGRVALVKAVLDNEVALAEE